MVSLYIPAAHENLEKISVLKQFENLNSSFKLGVVWPLIQAIEKTAYAGETTFEFDILETYSNMRKLDSGIMELPIDKFALCMNKLVEVLKLKGYHVLVPDYVVNKRLRISFAPNANETLYDELNSSTNSFYSTIYRNGVTRDPHMIESVERLKNDLRRIASGGSYYRKFEIDELKELYDIDTTDEMWYTKFMAEMALSRCHIIKNDGYLSISWGDSCKTL